MSLNDDAPLRLSHIEKSFGDTKVIRDFSLELAPRERVALIGPSGSGKTTLLRMAMALEVPDAGDVEIFGESYWPPGLRKRAAYNHLREVRKSVGIVFQAYNLFPHMTVMQNMLEAPMNVLKISSEDATIRARELLSDFGLAGKESSYPRQLSGGQAQRVSVARALMLKPKLLLLDEITSALDPELVAEVLRVIQEVARKTDVAMLIVTHEMAFAKQVADRVCFLSDGVVTEEGTPKDLFENPTHPRTQEFLNSIAAGGFAL